MLIKNLNEKENLEGFTLILPSVSVGNVGQLAVDFLIHHLKASKIYQFWHEAVLPVVGKNPFDENSSELGLPVEVFAATAQKLVLVQIRSPTLKKNETEFLSEVIDFFKDRNVKQTIILSSLYAQNRLDAQITDNRVRYIACPTMSKDHKSEFDGLNWKSLEQYSPEASVLNLSGAGLAKKAFKLCQSKNLPCLILFKFCFDGNNIPDAIELVYFLDSWLNVTTIKDKNYGFKMPPSWKFLFGVPGPKEIY